MVINDIFIKVAELKDFELIHSLGCPNVTEHHIFMKARFLNTFKGSDYADYARNYKSMVEIILFPYIYLFILAIKMPFVPFLIVIIIDRNS